MSTDLILLGLDWAGVSYFEMHYRTDSIVMTAAPIVPRLKGACIKCSIFDHIRRLWSMALSLADPFEGLVSGRYAWLPRMLDLARLEPIT